jgi:ribonuclease D
MTEYVSACFPEVVYYAETERDITLLANLITEARPSYVGFDTEMLDSRLHANPYMYTTWNKRFSPAVMIQIALEKTVYIFHLHGSYKTRMMPIALQRLLTSSNILKVGFATTNDTVALLRTYDVHVDPIIDLRVIMPTIDKPCNSLADLARHYDLQLEKNIPHDWNKSLMSHSVNTDALDYAARDAAVCRIAWNDYLRTISSHVLHTPLLNAHGSLRST